ncbi:selenocysteine lyase/cysteine desulfurase [Rhodovulum imhoffii]|uniref:Selenocysteine lyase/cysteine desulfurase n=1 Tax=Rhodovulum imhoffii TaxID=365340 RepID=A0A2T5BVH9_9RHOB|nr:aminotransferase class V-fold PLP-dependent enzyme [Rhodovulum imhoffii]MBK5932846.1 nitrogen fixation protein NifS [Rhodovulum imhoffii]PTN03584.1 selenocysteine lyase/cysteine desulfurase [Rhodovulum imhoffii]
MTSLDLAFVRNQFTAFQDPAQRRLAFMENAGGSLPCRYTIWRLNRFYHERKVQPYGVGAPSLRAGEEMDAARYRLAAHLGVARDEIHFGPSTSANTYVLAQAVRQWLKPGAAIIVTNQDHEANTGVWRRLADGGVEIREWQVDPETGALHPERLEVLLDDKVRLVCFPHCSNILGHVNDVGALCSRIRAAGAVSCVDGVSFAPHGLPNIGKLGADIYLFSAYKTFGPHQGIMTLRRDLARVLPHQGHDFNAGNLLCRFTPAGPDHAQVAACAALADYVDALYEHHYRAGRDPVGRSAKVAELCRAHEIALVEPLLEFLRSRGLRILGPDRPGWNRVPTVSLQVPEPGVSLAERLAKHGILTGGGNFYAPRLLSAMGVDPAEGVLRISLVHYNSPLEVDRLIRALDCEL